jgi:hypothetical protein
MSQRLSNQQKFLQDVKNKITAFTNQLSANGLLHSSVQASGLCDLLLDNLADYIISESNRILAGVRAGKTPSLSPTEFNKSLKASANGIIEQFDSILVNSMSQSGLPDKARDGMFAQLNFRGRAEHVIDEKCNILEAEYAEELASKKSAQKQLRIAIISLYSGAVLSLVSILISATSAYFSYLATQQTSQVSQDYMQKQFLQVCKIKDI